MLRLLRVGLVLLFGIRPLLVAADWTASGEIRIEAREVVEGVTKVTRFAVRWDEDGRLSSENSDETGRYSLAFQAPEGCYLRRTRPRKPVEVTFLFEDDDLFLSWGSLDDYTPVPSLLLGDLPPGAEPVAGQKGTYVWFDRRIELTRSSDGTASKIKVIGQDGRVNQEYVYEGRVGQGTGGPVAARCTAKVRADTAGFKEVAYQVTKYDVESRQDLSGLVTDWYRPGVVVMDYRVRPEVMWTYADLRDASKSVAALTPDDLLKLSRSRSELIALGAEPNGKARARPFGTNKLVGIGLVTVVGLAIHFAWQGWKRYRRDGGAAT